ncbi:MAG TPA: ABC transporter permease subunit [Mycobacteriales bacterium]|nr:ABC transporter permease subunit [Mycobacteriales bacterium]
MGGSDPLLLEITPRQDTGVDAAERSGMPRWPVVYLLLAAVPVCAMLVAPLVYTVVTSFWVGPGHGYFGVAHYLAIWRDPQIRHAVANSLRWLSIAPLVCLVGFVLARVSRDARRSRAFLIGVIAAPMAVSALITGITFRLMFAPQPSPGVVTDLASTVAGWFGGSAPLPGAQPDPGATTFVPAPSAGAGGLSFAVDRTTGDLTTSAVTPGQVVDLGLVGVPAPPGRGLTFQDLPSIAPGQVRGVVTVRGRPVSGIPVTIYRLLDVVASTRTDRHGAFQFDVSDQSAAADARYVLHIPAAAIAPKSDRVAFLGSSWIGWVLGSAFVWGWMGFAVVVFRAGLAAVPADLLRVARAFGAGRLRTAFTVTAPALIPVTAVVLLTLLVAAVRVFDLVLVAAPGSVQANADVIGLHWWRSQGTLGSGGSAALAVLLFALVAVFALAALWGLNREWPTSPRPVADSQGSPSPVRRWVVRAVGVAVLALWSVPFATLLFTSLHSDQDATRAGWWAFGRVGVSLDSYRSVFHSGLPSALLATAERATFSTVGLMLLAVPAAYALACGEFPARVERTLVAVTSVLAVVPVQAVASPLARAFNLVRGFGSPTLLTITHAVFGIPFAVLLLRPAFRAELRRRTPPGDPRVDRDRVPRLDRDILGAVWTSALAVAVLEFVLVWNDLVVSLTLSGPQSGSLMLALFGQVRNFATTSGTLAAASVMSMLVPLVLVLVTGRWVVRGLAAGVLR